MPTIVAPENELWDAANRSQSVAKMLMAWVWFHYNCGMALQRNIGAGPGRASTKSLIPTAEPTDPWIFKSPHVLLQAIEENSRCLWSWPPTSSLINPSSSIPVQSTINNRYSLPEDIEPSINTSPGSPAYLLMEPWSHHIVPYTEMVFIIFSKCSIHVLRTYWCSRMFLKQK